MVNPVNTVNAGLVTSVTEVTKNLGDWVPCSWAGDGGRLRPAGYPLPVLKRSVSENERHP